MSVVDRGGRLPPDKLSVSETRIRRSATASASGATGHDGGGAVRDGGDSSESITSESFSEMYQDSKVPFRSNIFSYRGKHALCNTFLCLSLVYTALEGSKRSNRPRGRGR
ncbi:uncharacterized protein A1O5_05318 [Cladophialophora psammophila CBS 110553]|uniref:Uncharacterized protein n=1 Tax=Cladophialophora psammophila CBS 110553 TaxID=1182543 RepID=W9X2G9_9EURO|nr:uncharacterized protein A1O5_05318 [Cladophialophora psammophila CBS 110553]EXJ71510.1 hypothetical protein A1O5_05318 [Cladophialophora psammophila CBS 110553]